MSRIESISRHPQRLAAAGALLFAYGIALTACEAQKPNASSENARTESSARGEPFEPPGGLESGTGGGVKVICNGKEMRLQDDATDPATGMKRTKLQFVRSGRAVSAIGLPGEMRDYTPVGVSCAISRSNGRPYFVVQFGERPRGCKFCEWFYLYDQDGKQLTRSVPVILKDETLPETQQQYPNNEEYTALAERLRLPDAEMSYID
ncbi:hypothetical protein [Lysobacter sp. M15]|uniref:hypothetical protein n=1 Tax=Lysobacter sp. M15 TaxID=2916837 RepID=UPI001F58BE81|nr:hypothetical protein [Lysobacter sp. M15]